MKDFAPYWGKLIGNNPRLTDETGYIKMTVQEFRKQLELAWRESQKLATNGEMFDLLFGGRK